LREHKPTNELIKRASTIADPTQRRQVIKDIKNLRNRYAETSAEFKAPDGQPSGLIASLGKELGQQAWYAVRTPAFKDWFGDWELTIQIKAFENSQDVPLKGNSYQDKYELNRESILAYLKNTLSKTTMHNSAINEEIRLGGTGIDKIVGWGMNNEAYKKLFAHIPEITEKAVFLAEEKPNRPRAHYNKYSHLAAGIRLDGDPYTVHIILGESGGQWYYSHILLHIKKGSLLNGIRQSTPGHSQATPLAGIKDTTLLRLLQGDSSKIIDEHGEPKPVFRGDKPDKELFANPQGTFFTSEKALAKNYSSGGLYELFLYMKNPLILNEKNFIEIREQINDMLVDIYEKDRSELEHDLRYQALRKNYLAFRNEQGSSVRDFYNNFLPKVSEDTDFDDFKEILLKSVHDANAFEWRQIDYRDIDILNPFVRCLGYDGIVRQYDPLGQAFGTEYVAFDPRQIKSVAANAGTYDCDNPFFTNINKFAKTQENPSLERSKNNIKEKPMSDLNEVSTEEKNLSPRELAFQNTVYQRNMVGAALKNGTLCCLPEKDGYADTTPAMNLANHNVYHGDTLLYLKDHQKKNGFPTGEYLTQAQIEKAREDVPGLSLLKGQKGVSIHVSEKNDETGEWDEKHIRLFNVAQLGGNGPAKFKKWVEDKRLEYFQSQHGTKIQPPEPGQKTKGPEIVCSSPDPVKYLGQYFAAVSKGIPFKADQETAKEFAKNMGDSLYKKIGTSPRTGDPVTDPFSLSKICREANKYCKEFMSELGRQQNPEPKQEQQQSRKGRKL
jgi:hypothetical protein